MDERRSVPALQLVSTLFVGILRGFNLEIVSLIIFFFPEQLCVETTRAFFH